MTIEKWDQFKALRMAGLIGALWVENKQFYRLGPARPNPNEGTEYHQARLISTEKLDRLIDGLTAPKT